MKVVEFIAKTIYAMLVGFGTAWIIQKFLDR